MKGTKVTNSQDQDNSFVVPVVTLGLLNLCALTASASKAELCGPQRAVLTSDFLKQEAIHLSPKPSVSVCESRGHDFQLTLNLVNDREKGRVGSEKPMLCGVLGVSF